jgi:ERF superfamily protein
MRTSAELDQIAKALVAAQSKLENPKVDAKAKVTTKSGGSYEYEYVTLDRMTEHVRAALTPHGLAFTQEDVTDPDGPVGVLTRIFHVSGQWIEYGPLTFAVEGGPQDAGGALTYARRYALAAAVGIAADADDDAAGVQASSRTAGRDNKAGRGGLAGSPASRPAAPPAEESGAGEGAHSSALDVAVELYGGRPHLLRAAREHWPSATMRLRRIEDLDADELEELIAGKRPALEPAGEGYER